MPELRTLMSGLVFGEQPRWHQDRLWFSDWGRQEVIAVDLNGNSEVILRGASFPLCVDWLPDGSLLVVSARDGLLLRREHDGSLVTYGDLNTASDPPAINELVDAAATPTSTARTSTSPPVATQAGLHQARHADGQLRHIADDIQFPNGMVITRTARR